MARPIKESLNYFPLDTGFFGDRKIKRLLKTFGGKGTTVYTFLLCEIYRDKGYFLQWDENYPEDIADALGAGFTSSLVSEVLALCLKIGLFDSDLFSSLSILTSTGIQKRYISAKETISKKRYNPDELLFTDYSLLSEINGSLTPLNAVERRKTELSGVLPPKGKERKRKERKGKERKSFGENPKHDPPDPSPKNTFAISDLLPEHEPATPEIIPEHQEALYNSLLKALGKISITPEELHIGQQLLAADCTLKDIEQARISKGKNNLKYLRNIVCECRDRRLNQKSKGDWLEDLQNMNLEE